jgi:hypothetical protein
MQFRGTVSEKKNADGLRAGILTSRFSLAAVVLGGGKLGFCARKCFARVSVQNVAEYCCKKTWVFQGVLPFVNSR